MRILSLKGHLFHGHKHINSIWMVSFSWWSFIIHQAEWGVTMKHCFLHDISPTKVVVYWGDRGVIWINQNDLKVMPLEWWLVRLRIPNGIITGCWIIIFSQNNDVHVFLIGVAQVKLVVLTGCDWDSMGFQWVFDWDFKGLLMILMV